MTGAVLLAGPRHGDLVAFERCMAGLEVDIARALSAAAALEFVADHDPALVVLDLRLSDLDGIETARLIHGDRTKRHIPIILVTRPDALDVVMYRAFEAGVLDLITAPFQCGLVRAKVVLYMELHHSRKRVERQKELLLRSNEEFREFAYAAAHDLRAPLRSVKHMVSWLIDDAEDASTRADLAEQVVHGVDRMDTMVLAMLQFAEVGHGERNRGAVDLERVVAEVMEMLAVEIGEVGATVDLAPLPTVTGDEVQLRRLVQNVVSNSIKYRRHDELLHISVAGELDDGMVRIGFRDNGSGFDPSLADELFRPFRRLTASTEIEGAGIGMATARKIAAAHGGGMGADGKVGVGAQFWFTLPMTTAEISAFRQRLGAADAVSAAVPARAKILVVDDCAADRVLAERCFRDDFDVVCADGPARALEILDDSIDVVLSDCDMPEHDGVWLLSKLRAERRGVRRLMMSGMFGDRCRAALASGAAEAVFEKPVTSADLRRVLQTAS